MRTALMAGAPIGHMTVHKKPGSPSKVILRWIIQSLTHSRSVLGIFGQNSDPSSGAKICAELGVRMDSGFGMEVSLVYLATSRLIGKHRSFSTLSKRNIEKQMVTQDTL